MSGARSALIVATYQYDDPRLRSLRAPERDADALAEVLGDAAIGGFDVQTLVNQSSHDISLRVAEFFAQRRPDDVLLLHFSCHGVKDDSGELFLAATDTRMDLLDATAVSSAYVNRSMTRSRSGCVVLLLDCCYSGAFARGMTRAAADVDLTDQFGGRGRAVITATTALQFAFEGEDLSADGATSSSPSVFTRALVDGLRTGEADRDADGIVSLDELYAHVHDEVTRVNPDQTPQKWLFDVTGDLRVARRATPVAVPSELPAPLVDSLESLVSWERASAIEPLAAILRGPHPGRALAAKIALARLAAEDDSLRVRHAAQEVLDAWTDLRTARAAPPQPRETPDVARPPLPAAEATAAALPGTPPASRRHPPVANEEPAPRPTAPQPSPQNVRVRRPRPPNSRKSIRAGLTSADPWQIARWFSVGAAAIAVLALLALRASMETAVQASRGLPTGGPWSTLVWLLPAFPIVVAIWLIARHGLAGVALGCLASAWMWVFSSWLWIQSKPPESGVTPTDTWAPSILLALLLGGIAGLIVAAPELRERVHPNRGSRALATGLLLMAAIILRVEAAPIARTVAATGHPAPRLQSPFEHSSVWLAILIPIVICLPATLFALNRAQAQTLLTSAYLAIFYAVVFGTLQVAHPVDGFRSSTVRVVFRIVYLVGSVAILLAVRAGQPRQASRGHPISPFRQQPSDRGSQHSRP